MTASTTPRNGHQPFHTHDVTLPVDIASEDNLLWDDLRVPLESTGKGVNAPALATFRDGLNAYEFAAAGTNEVFADAQLPHTWAAGTGIRPHIHWSPGNSTNTGSVRWGLEYSWANAVQAPGNVWPASTTLYVTQAATGVAYSHQIAQFAEIDGTGFRLSSVLLIRLFRDGGNAADTFTGTAFGISFDIHHQNATGGSVPEYPTA